MARPRRETMNDVNRRSELVRTAATLFQEKGYDQTKIRDIARAMNMHTGSPFYHFASKQDLLYACVKEGLSATFSALQAIERDSLPPLDYFRKLARTHVCRLLDTERKMAPMVVRDWSYLEGEQLIEILEIRRQFEGIWIAALQQLRDAGVIQKADGLTCRFFLSALNGTVQWYRPSGPLSPMQVADELVDFLLCGSIKVKKDPEFVAKRRG